MTTSTTLICPFHEPSRHSSYPWKASLRDSVAIVSGDMESRQTMITQPLAIICESPSTLVEKSILQFSVFRTSQSLLRLSTNGTGSGNPESAKRTIQSQTTSAGAGQSSFPWRPRADQGGALDPMRGIAHRFGGRVANEDCASGHYFEAA